MQHDNHYSTKPHNVNNTTFIILNAAAQKKTTNTYYKNKICMSTLIKNIIINVAEEVQSLFYWQNQLGILLGMPKKNFAIFNNYRELLH